MRTRKITALVLLFSLAGAAFAFAGTAGRIPKAELIAETLQGDPAAADGITVCLNGKLPDRLYWQLTGGIGEQPERCFYGKDPQRHAPEETNYPDVQLTTLPTGETWGIWRVFDAPGAHTEEANRNRAEKREQIAEVMTENWQEVIETAEAKAPVTGDDGETPAEEVPEAIVPMGKLFRYYVIGGACIAKNRSYPIDFEQLLDDDSKMGEATNRWQLFHRFFRIPVLERESMHYSFERDDSGYVHYTCGYGRAEDVETFLFRTISCHTGDAVYFTFDPRSDKGTLVDVSRIPGGYGIYRLPYDKTTDSFRPEQLEMVYALDVNRKYLQLSVSPDGSRLAAVYTEPAAEPKQSENGSRKAGETASVEVIRLASMRCEARMEVLQGAPGSEEISCRDEGDYLIFADGKERLSVLYYEKGAYRLALYAEDLDFKTDTLAALSSINTATACDGRRLAVITHEKRSVDERDARWKTQGYTGADELTVLGDGRLLYRGRLHSNLADYYDEATRAAWLDAIGRTDPAHRVYLDNTGDDSNDGLTHNDLDEGIAELRIRQDR